MTSSAAVECLLFVAGEPLGLPDLARALQCDEDAARAALSDLEARLESTGSGLQVVQIAGGWQLASRPEHGETIARLLARGSNKLSRPALETLAIIAYRQPITQPEIEAVRGVASGSVVKTLVERGLIADVGRKQTVGRPILYATTREFLHYFGLSELSELPPLEELPEGVQAFGRSGDEDDGGRQTEDGPSPESEPSTFNLQPSTHSGLTTHDSRLNPSPV